MTRGYRSYASGLLPRPKRRKTYDTGFRDGVLFAIAVQVLVFAACGAGYVVAQVVG